MQNNDTNINRRKKFYDQMSEAYDLGTFEEFDSKMNNAESREKLYKFIDGDGKYDIGTFEHFNEAMSPTVPETPTMQTQNITDTTTENTTVSVPADTSVADTTNKMQAASVTTENTPEQHDWREDDVETGMDASGNPIYTKKGKLYDNLSLIFNNAAKTGNIGDKSAYAQTREAAEKEGVADMPTLMQIVGSINRQYAKDEARDITQEMMESMPERSADVMEALRSVYYNRDLQNRLSRTAASMGNDYQDYINMFVKPQLIEALKQKYGGDDNEWQGVRGLFSNWQHVGDRLESQEVSELLRDRFTSDISEALSQGEARAAEVAEAHNNSISPYTDPGLDFGAIGATKKANEAKDPDKILKGLIDGIGGATMEILQDEELSNEIMTRAQSKNMSTDAYIQKYVAPQMQQAMAEQFQKMAIEREIPKSTVEYVLRGLTDDSIIGMIYNRMTNTASQQEYRNIADAMSSEQRSVWEEGARLAAGMASDFWLWGGWGKLGAKATGELLARRIAERAAAEHITTAAAARLIEEEGKQFLSKGIVEGMMRHIPQSAVTLGGAQGTTAMIRGIRDREKAATIIGNTLGEAASGATTGTLFGFTGGAASRLTSQLTGLKRLAGKIASFGTEAATMYTAEELQKMANGEDAFQNPYDGLIESGIKLGFIKLSANPLATGIKLVEAMKNPVAAVKRAMTPDNPLLTEDDVKAIRESASGAELMDALTRMRPARKTDTEEREGYIGEADAEIAAEGYRDFMTDPAHSWVLKNKVAHLLGGMINPAGREIKSEVAETADGAFVRTYDIDNNLINETRYNNVDAANRAAADMSETIESNINDALADKINEIDAYERFGNFIEEGYRRAAQKMVSAEKEGVGEALSDVERQFVYLHQHKNELMDVYTKLESGEPLGVDEQKLVDLYTQYFKDYIEKGYASQEFVREFEYQTGLPEGTLQKAYEGTTDKDGKRTRTPLQQNILDAYRYAALKYIAEKQGMRRDTQDFAPEENLLPGSTQTPPSDGTETPPSGTNASGPETSVERSERRDAAYQRGSSVVDDETDLPSIGYDSRLAIARVMQLMPDGSRLEAIRKNIIQAVESGDLDKAEELFANAAPYLNDTQKEALDQYIDAATTQTGVDDAITEQAAAYEAETRQWLQQRADEQGNITQVIMKDGRTMFLIKGDKNNRFSMMLVTDGEHEPEQHLVSEAAQFGKPEPMEVTLSNMVNMYADNIQKRYNGLTDGSWFDNGQQVEFIIGGQRVTATKAGNDEFGNPIFTMEDGSQMALRPDEAQLGVKAAENAKIQQQIASEAEAAKLAEQQQAFTTGIKGYAEGSPDLTAPETDAKTAADYLLSETNGDDKLRKERITTIDNTRQQLQQRNEEAKRELAQLQSWLAGNEDIATPQEVDEAKAKIQQIQQAIADVETRAKKWGDIRRNLMTKEEVEALEQQRRKQVFDARTGYTPQLPVANLATDNATGITLENGEANFGRTSVGNVNNYLLRNYPDSYQAEQFITEQRLKLRNKQRDEIQPAINQRNDMLNDYTNGKTELSPEEIKQLVHEVADLEAQQDALSQQAVRLREIADGIQALYERKGKVEQLTPSEQRAAQLDKATSKEDKLRIARTLYNEYPEALDRINDQEPRDLEEFIAANLGQGSMNWEGYDQGGRHLIGVQEAVFGKRGATRGIGKSYATNAFNHYLAPTGEGKDFNTIVHGLYEALPDVGDSKQWTTEDISDALINMLLTAQKPSYISHRIIDNRIAEAEEIVQHEEEYEREMEEMAKLEEMQAWADAYHLSPEEREEFEEFMKMAPTELELDVINNLITNEQDSRSNELDSQPISDGNGSEGERSQGEVLGQSEEQDVGNRGEQHPVTRRETGASDEAVAGDNVPGGTQERVAEIKQAIKNHESKYRTLAPVEVLSIDSDDDLQKLAGDEYEEARQFIKENKIPAIYDEGSKKIYIFAEFMDLALTEEALFHESLHRGLRQYYGENPTELCDRFWETTSTTNPELSERHKKETAEDYKDQPDHIKEEYFVGLMGSHMARGLVDNILKRLNDEDREIINNILTNIGYDTAEETKRRTAQREAERSGENGERRQDTYSQETGNDGGRVEDTSFAARLAKAIAETNTTPTEAQKEAGNYRKPAVKFGGYTFRIENPKGSIRSGVDRSGRKWSQEMHDTYGYIEEKVGKDGDKMDFFINDDADLDNWNGRVFIIDQKNEDGTFDEHKVMYGYPTLRAARQAYERNYEEGWYDKHVKAIMGVKKADFDKWLAESDHKLKPFSEYFHTKILKDTVRDNVDQLMADVAERKDKVTTQYGEKQLESMDLSTLSQLIKKARKDAATSRVILGTTNVKPDSDKAATLKRNIAQAEADIESLQAAQNRLKEQMKRVIEDAEAGGAAIDHLQDMGIDVTADPSTNRKVHKQAENDNSKEGKLRHMRTPDGTIYGFTYRGKMYLDPRKMDANRPLHEYSHLWGEAFRRLNPEGWKDVVSVMKQDADTWRFIKSINPDLKNDDDIAEEMIANGTGERGQERIRQEFERMSQRDPSYKGKWNNIWKNISKAIQDFWKKVGDFLHIKYETTEQVYDQVLKDFANGVNPRKKVEQYLKQRDAEYAEAVKSGNTGKATEIFNEALKENVGNGMTPFVAVDKYRKMQSLAHKIKNGDADGIEQAAELMAPLIPENAVLIPTPAHSGKATTMLELANAIAERTGSEVADILESEPRASQYDTKKQGSKAIAAKDMGIKVNGQLPDGKVPVVIDNVVDTGNTAEACVQALGTGIVASLADSTELGKRVATLRSAAPIIANKQGELIPLSERFDLSRKETGRPVDAIDTLMDEMENRREAAADREQLEAAIMTDQEEAERKAVDSDVRERATKAVLKAIDNTGVPVKQVSREEADRMMQAYTMLNQQAIADFARSLRPDRFKRYAVINVRDPFAVPTYFEKKKLATDFLEWARRNKRLYEMFDLGNDEQLESAKLRDAANIMPMTGWHGSGAVFTKFDHSHMGEGAGSQAFGWGTYISDSSKIGKDYSERLNKGWSYQGKYREDFKLFQDGKNHKSDAVRDILSAMNSGDSFEKARQRTERFIESAIRDYEDEIKHLSEADKEDLKDLREILEFVNSMKPQDFKKDPSNLYKVNIPDDTGNNYLDFNKKPSKRIISKIAKTLEDEGVNWDMRLPNYVEESNKTAQLFWAIHNIGYTNKGDGRDLYEVLSIILGSDKAASKFLNNLGFTGVKYPAGTIMGNGDGATNYVIFNEDDAKITERIEFMFDNESPAEAPIFYSNALKAVDGIRQEKGTPDQWLAMIQKNGGLKAGEDKWLGLSDWLNEQKLAGKSVTKQDILDFIRKNQIQIEETHYQNFNSSDNSRLKEFNDEYQQNFTKAMKEMRAVAKEYDAFDDEMLEKYGKGWANKLEGEDKKRNEALEERYAAYKNPEEAAFKMMVDEYGDDFEQAFEVFNHELIPITDYYDEPNEAAKHFLGADNVINSTRLEYTTDGLENKREIALTIPTIDPYNEYDEVHFGDAGDGRAVAWVRFGDTTDADGNKVLVIDEIQSKRHQDARENGYLSEIKAAGEKEKGEIMKRYNELSAERDKLIDRDMKRRDEIRESDAGQACIGEDGYIKEGKVEEYQALFDNDPELNELESQRSTLVSQLREIEQERRDWNNRFKGGVPDAPFEKNWHELAMKRMLRYAAENGYDKIAWTTGAQQAERYDIGGIVPYIDVEVNPDSSDYYRDMRFSANGNGCRVAANEEGKITLAEGLGEDAVGKSLGEVFGKEVAIEIMGADKAKRIQLEGKRIGGEGMKGFYDEILPRFMNKYGKKWDVKVGEIDLPNLEESAQKMWSIDITPDMRNSVMQGQPMFQKNRGGKVYGWTDGKQIYLTPDGMNPNTPAHEYTHLWAAYMEKFNPQLWKSIVNAMMKTDMWQQIRENTNYRSIWENENKMASEVLSRLSGATTEDEFVKAATGNKKGTEAILSAVRNALKKFWDAVLRLFGKTSKIASDMSDSYEAIIRMPLRDMLRGFNPVTADASLQPEVGDVVEKTLMGVHNISEEKLKKAIKLGGLANPSLAVIDTKNGIHTDYGEISLIPRSSLIDAKTGRNAGTYAGDAWTPTYPSITKEMTSKGEKHKNQIAKEAAGGNEELEHHLARTMERYVDDNENRLHLLYLLQKGIKPDLIPESTIHTHDEYEALRKILGNDQLRYSSDGLTKEQNDAILDLMMKGVREKAEESSKLIKDEEKRQKAVETVVKMRKDSLVDPETGKIWFAKYDTYIYDVLRDEKRRQNPKIDWYKTDNEASYRVAKKNLSEDYEAWKEQLFGDDDIAEKLFAGWTEDGNKKYVKNTVVNASRLMNKEADTNAYGNGGLSASKAGLVKKLKTLADIRKYRHLIKVGDDIKEQLKEKESEWFDIIEQVSQMQKVDSNPFINNDIAEARLQEAMEQRDPISYMNKEYGYHIEKDSELASQLMNFMEEASELPVKYFETKFKRPVALSEFAIAVVPTATSSEVVKALKDAGLDVHTYEKGDTGDEKDEARRQAVLNAVHGRSDILFHIEEDKDTIERLEKEPKETGYRNVVLNEDGSLGSPMASKLNKVGVKSKPTSPFEMGKWERSDENPQLATEDGKINLVKPGNKRVDNVDYNPYIHIRPNKVNKQFKQAWERPNLVYVETQYPQSELQGDYQAEKAALPVGKHPWGGGELILSRWDKPVRIVPWEEVADDWEKEFKDRGVEFDIIPPALLPILAKRGVEILPPHKGMGKACNEAYEAWKNGTLYRRTTPAIIDVNEKFNNDLEKLSDKSILDLGKPSAILIAAGIENKPLRLRGTKLMAKIKKHGYEAKDVKNLPLAVHDPIAIFKGSTPDSFAILTELNIGDKNVLVAIRAGKGVDIDFNVISSAYGKNGDSILNWINNNKLLYVNKEKAVEYLYNPAPIAEIADSTAKNSLNSAANVVQNFDNPKISEENLRNIYAKEVRVAEETADMLGGEKITFESEANEDGALGWYDPNDGSIHVALPAHADVEDVQRTVCHEKLGHEGLVALLGSQKEVDKFGHFVLRSANAELKKRIIAKAGEIDPEWNDPLRYSHAAQEVIADIAADGPRTADEFSLWRKIKHYLIRFLNKLGLRIRGLLNDHDLSYYILKTGEALKKWNGMSDAQKREAAQQGYDTMYSRGKGKPKKRNNESMAQYLQRLREWERWKIAEQQARDNNDPMPTIEEVNAKWEERYRNDLAEWKQRNNIGENTPQLGEFPKRKPNETPQEYAMRVADYETQADIWKEAPSLFDYLNNANREYRDAYRAWRERYGIQEAENVDLGLYEGDPESMPHIVDPEDLEAENRADAELAEAVGIDMSSEGAKRHTKLAVIERRKNLESANAEDAIWIHNLVKRLDEEAKRQGVSPKELRKNMADIIEGTYFEDVLRDENGNVVSIIDISDQLPIKMTDGLKEILSDIKDWYDYFYHQLEDAGLRGEAGYVEEGYVNHVWSREKSNPSAWEKYIENFQRTKSPNMRERIFQDYRSGEEVGLVRKFDDIAQIIAYYSSSNNQAIANKKFLDALSFVVVEETNSDGEVTQVLPLLNSQKPDAFTADRYDIYKVPGVGSVWVIKDIQRTFSNVFGTMRTKDVADWVSKFGRTYDIVSSTVKKIQLSFSAFHMGALWEVSMAQMRPDRSLIALAKYIIFDCTIKGTIPAYAHPEDFKFAASHLVQLGATQDYSAADVNNLTEKFRDVVRELANDENLAKKGVGYAVTPVAAALDYINKSLDKVLWNYLHDGFKIACFKMFAEQIEKRVVKEGLTPEKREELLDEAGQYVNDTFGGQYWELLDVSPSTVKWLRRAFLSPDWLISTQRHFLANFGFGSLYSESGFLNYLRYNADNIKRVFGVDVPKDENRRFRSSNAKKCYILGVCVFFYTMMNALNAFFRAQDEEKEKAKADEIRKTNPDYKSGYELAYPDGMKWYDYTMYGNTVGQQTHLFLGRYNDGTEWYARWGKQFREFPELFMGRHGVEFPTPLMERMSGKANPVGRYLLYDLPLTVGMYGYRQPRETQEIADKYGNTVALLAMTAKKFVPYSVPTQEGKEFKLFDLVMPSQKGFTQWKAMDYFKTYIEAGDMDGIERTYNAAVMNGLNAERALKGAISSIKAAQRKELSDGIDDLQTAMERFDAAKTIDERKLMKRKVLKYLADQNYKAYSRDEAREQVQSFLNDDQPTETANTKYLELQTSADVRNDYRISALKKKAKKYVDEIMEAEDERRDELIKSYRHWFQIQRIIRDSDSATNKLKKQLGKGKDDAEIMNQIRDIKSQTQKQIDAVSPKK